MLCPPPRAAYSHSASLGNRPPAHAQNATACSQSTQFKGWLSFPLTPQLQSETMPGALHALACTHALYCATVTSVFLISKAGTSTWCTGCSSEAFVEPI